jgi:hypothetical protein
MSRRWLRSWSRRWRLRHIVGWRSKNAGRRDVGGGNQAQSRRDGALASATATGLSSSRTRARSARRVFCRRRRAMPASTTCRMFTATRLFSGLCTIRPGSAGRAGTAGAAGRARAYEATGDPLAADPRCGVNPAFAVVSFRRGLLTMSGRHFAGDASLDLAAEHNGALLPKSLTPRNLRPAL